MGQILLIEPFYGGSHKQLIDLLCEEVPGCVKIVLPAKKWHWRARTSALYISQQIPPQHNFRILFASSVLNLAELLALRPDLTPLKKVLYFHENQLAYPVRKHQDRDFQYGYNQVLSCLVADVILFNSQYNQDSFLSSIQTHINVMPDCRPKGLAEQIRPKCRVLYFPINFPAHWRDCRSKIRTNSASQHSAVNTGTYSASQPFTMDYAGTDSVGQLSTADCAETSADKDRTDDFFLDTMKINKDNAQLAATSTTSVTGSPNENSLCEGLPATCSDGDKKSPQHDIKREGTILVSPDVHVGNHSSVKSKICQGKEKPSSSYCENSKTGLDGRTEDRPLHIVWPHRWEHDKNPDLFFKTLFELKAEGNSFVVSVLGQEYTDVPEIFSEAADKLKEEIEQWGHLAAKEDYFRLLHLADVVVSTADHEFYGVSMLEAVYCGCYPLCPNRLVYPEIFPKECLYNTPQQLKKRLRDFCRRPQLARKHMINLAVHQYSWENLAEEYRKLLQC